MSKENKLEQEILNPFMDYTISYGGLPETPNWDNTQWLYDVKGSIYNNDKYLVSVPDKVVYKVINENKVKSVSTFKTFKELLMDDFNARTKKFFRLAWMNEFNSEYIQFFDPSKQGLSLLTINDSDSSKSITLPLDPFFIKKTSNNTFSIYQPSFEDMIAEDWICHEYVSDVLRDEVYVDEKDEELPEEIEEFIKRLNPDSKVKVIKINLGNNEKEDTKNTTDTLNIEDIKNNTDIIDSIKNILKSIGATEISPDDICNCPSCIQKKNNEKKKEKIEKQEIPEELKEILSQIFNKGK